MFKVLMTMTNKLITTVTRMMMMITMTTITTIITTTTTYFYYDNDDLLLLLLLLLDRFVGLVVKASASRVEGPGFESRLRRDFFGVESYQ